MPLILRPPTGRESLTERLGDLGRTRRVVAVAAAAFTLVAAVAAALAVAGLLDAWIGLPALLRGFVLVGILSLAAVLFLRRLLPALMLRTDALAIAHDLEDRFPRLNDSLASAVSFLTEDEANGVHTGSRRLRQAAVRRAAKLAERYDFRQVTATGLGWRAFWACAFVLLITTALVMTGPQRAFLAAVRVADPFGIHPWPPKTAIAITQPQNFPARIAVGERFDLAFEIRGVVPEQAEIRVQFASGGGFTKTVSLAAGPEAPADFRSVAAPLDGGQITESFTFAITANDGTTVWQSVTVAPPPKLVPRDGRASPQVHLEFPGYTRLAAIDLPDGAGVIEAPFGSRITLRAAADLRLASAALTFLGDRSAIERAAPAATIGLRHPVSAIGAQFLADSIGRDVPITIGPNGHTLDVEFTPSMPGLYGLRFTDETGLTGMRLLELRLQLDPAPLAVLLQPAVGRDPAIFAPDVSLPVEVTAEDKLFALRRVFLEYRFGTEGPYREFVLHDGLATRTATTAIGGGWLAAADPRPDSFATKLAIPLAHFVHPNGNPAHDGDILTLRAAADDWDDVTVLKAPGRSAKIEIRIASREGIEAFLQKELATLRTDLLRAREQQRDAHQKTSEAVPKSDGTLSPDDREKLLNAEQIQKQLQARIADNRDGLRAKTDQLRATVRANALPRGGTRARIENIAEELGRLAERELGAIEPLIADARQAGSTPAPGNQKAIADLLGRADRRQRAVEDSLNSMLERLEQWGNAGEIAGEGRGLRDAIERQPIPDASSKDQERAAGKLDQLAEAAGGLLAKAGRFADEKEAAAKAANEAAAAKEAEAKSAAAEAQAATPGTPEARAARAKADALQGEADAAKQSAQKAAAEAEALRKAIRAAGGQALPDDLRQAANSARAGRPGEADAARRRASERLARLADALIEKPTPSQEEGLTKSNRKNADNLDALADAQDQLRKKVRDVARIPDPAARAEELQRLARDQDRLRDQAKDVLQKLTRQRNEEAARDVRGAVDQMEAARDDLERGEVPAQPQGEAIEKLERARDRLDKTEAEPARELSDEVRRKLADQLRALRDRQAAAEQEAERIAGEVTKAKAWPRPVQASLDDLANRERTLGEDVRRLSDKRFDRLPVLKRLLNDAAGAMDSAATRIGERLEDVIAADPNDAFDPAVETAASARFRRPMSLALRRLDQMLESLKPDEQKPADAKEAPGDEDAAPMAASGNEDIIPPLAQIKVLRALQAELNDRTAAFAKLHPNLDKLTAEERNELKELEQSQREIAALFEEMAAMFQPNQEAP